MGNNVDFSPKRSWGYNAKELLKYLGQVNHFKVEEECQVDPQVYLSKGDFSHLYTDSRRVDLVWYKTRQMLIPARKEFPFLSNEIVLACEIEASFDTKRMIQSVNNLDRLNASLGMVYLVLSVEIAKDIEKALSCLHVARLRLPTPMIVVTDLEVWYLYSLLNNNWERPNDPLNAYIDVLKKKYMEKETTNLAQLEALRSYWEKALRGDKNSQFFMKVPLPFRKRIRQRLSDFLNQKTN